MLTFLRKKGEGIRIGDLVEIVVLRIGKEVRLGIQCPREIRIYRGEIFEKIQQEKKGIKDGDGNAN